MSLSWLLLLNIAIWTIKSTWVSVFYTAIRRLFSSSSSLLTDRPETIIPNELEVNRRQPIFAFRVMLDAGM